MLLRAGFSVRCLYQFGHFPRNGTGGIRTHAPSRTYRVSNPASLPLEYSSKARFKRTGGLVRLQNHLRASSARRTASILSATRLQQTFGWSRRTGAPGDDPGGPGFGILAASQRATPRCHEQDVIGFLVLGGPHPFPLIPGSVQHPVSHGEWEGWDSNPQCHTTPILQTGALPSSFLPGVRRAGLEPARSFDHSPLKTAWLPDYTTCASGVVGATPMLHEPAMSKNQLGLETQND